MTRAIDIRTDVTDAVGIGRHVETVATVYIGEDVAEPAVVCFAWPGGGYGRHYFDFDMPDSGGGGQAGWHTRRGWIFVAVDTVNSGDSTHPDGVALTYEHLTAANDATVRAISRQLVEGTIADGVRAIVDPTTIGLGQSLGGSLAVLTQGQYGTFDAIAVLGFSGHHTKTWAPPSMAVGRRTYIPRGTNLAELTPDVFVSAMPEMAFDDNAMPLCAPGFHHQAEPAEIVAADMIDYPARRGELPVWASRTIPACAVTMMSPGAIASEAACVEVPVFVGVGERDTVPAPLSEPTAYPNSRDITVFVCEGMAHMHNFGGTRFRLWSRIHGWGEAVHAQRRESAELQS
ncbi:hypothetical protein CH296_26690 [Rhodococcus sp. 14-2496-1d]|uniref:hypothetical protein n=1 Tax=Rhodococcus sp. 14-2496-1d TaxID=2023146 RepID=UPI000B9B7BF1|nr:hypothetical protein [Rhodococcus sp. 14-2496-1d]OZF25703.1 hypothetical protein CH296_26690 [Rhodococcus sp. 14-2496-1d]